MFNSFLFSYQQSCGIYLTALCSYKELKNFSGNLENFPELENKNAQQEWEEIKATYFAETLSFSLSQKSQDLEENIIFLFCKFFPTFLGTSSHSGLLSYYLSPVEGNRPIVYVLENFIPTSLAKGIFLNSSYQNFFKSCEQDWPFIACVKEESTNKSIKATM